MGLLTPYRERLHFKQVDRLKQFRTPQLVAWQEKKIERIGVLINADMATMPSVQQFLKKLEKITKEVALLGFAEVKELKEPLPIDAFTKKELDWIWRPKGEKVIAFTKQSYDVLINICQRNCFPLQYLAASCDAKYKIGALTNYPNDYQLMLETENLESYINQVEFFLAKFRTQ